MKIKIVNPSKHASPSDETKASAGVDLRANINGEITLKPLEQSLIPTGLFIELPLDDEARIRPGSGLAIKKGLSVLNTPSTKDADTLAESEYGAGGFGHSESN